MDLDQQLRSLDKFKSHYDIFKDFNLNSDKPTIDNKAIVDMMVNQVIDDMKNFKNDKSQLLKQIDGLDNSSDKMIEDVMNNQDDIKKNKRYFKSY